MIVYENNFLSLDFKPNSPILMKHTRKSNIPLPNASSIKDLSVRFVINNFNEYI